MKNNCGKWALEAIDVLESLYNKIQILFLEPTATWDPNILGEAVNSMVNRPTSPLSRSVGIFQASGRSV